MASSMNGAHNKDEIQEDAQAGSGKHKKLNDYIPIYIPTIEPGLMEPGRQDERFLDFLRARPTNDWFVNSGFVDQSSSFSFFQHNVTPADESAPQEPGLNRSQRRFRVPFVRTINWGSMYRAFKRWLWKPQNFAFFIWLIFVLAGLTLLGLVMVGALNGLIPSNDRRKKWIEVINQILNAFFAILCLYQHPPLFHHLILLCRWKPKDRVDVRKAYCKDGGVRPHERAHMLFVVILLHITCFAQYVMCGFFWAYSREDRPDWVVNLCVVVGTLTPVVAGVYMMKSPLGKKCETESEELQNTDGLPRREVSVYNRRVVVTQPEWIGGLFDCWDDPTLFCCSLFCTFCVFGWNMERLGFGNMYVHLFTFLLLCVAPLIIFGAAALSIDDETISFVVGIVGLVLCVFGLLYGGFWRTQMRSKFKLPGNPFCWGYSWATDYVQWLYCWSCSLAQEVRTANFYDIKDDGFYRKETDESGRPVFLPLPRDGELGLRSYSCPPKIDPNDPKFAEVALDIDSSDVRYERASTYSRVLEMAPPVPPKI